MRVCILTNNTRTDNGWGRFAREFITALRTCGVEVVICSEEGGGYPDEHVVLTNSLRFSLHSFFKTLLHLPVLLRNALRVREHLGGCNLIHALDGYPYGVIGALASFGSKLPLMVTLQGTYSLDAFYHAVERKFLTWALCHARKVVCISSYMAREIKKYIAGISSQVIGHGTTSLWLSAPTDPRPPSIPKPYLLSVGTVKPQKGYRISLAAYARAREKFPDLSYVIVGFQGHEHFSKIQDEARVLGISSHVHFLTGLSDAELLRLYDHAELFVLTPVSMGTNIEGFGLVYREAGARGLAVIGSRDCGADDAVKDGVTGILCPQNDVDMVTRALEKLLADEKFRKDMGENGKKLAKRETWVLAARRYSAAYEAVVRRSQ
ncbi:MAG: glycosyltransferase family 4 protein [bacterium]|nr:glycosyltransferase family 4 protein [bacterium]